MTTMLMKAAFNPVLTGALIYLLTAAPEQYKTAVIETITSKTNGYIQIEPLVRGLKVLCSLGIIGRVNAKLNEVALSNWQWFKPSNVWKWNTEIAVVTGGSMGLGEGIVKELLSKGLRVAILDISDPPSDMKNNSRVLFVKCDITSRSDIHEAAQQIRSKFGEPSVLVNNAGIASHFSIVKIDPKVVEKTFAINIHSHWWMAQEFMPSMIKRNKGHIMAIASLGSFAVGAGVVHYTATKAALLAFQEGLMQEIKHIHKTPGILVSIVHPHYMGTPMMKEHGEKVDPNMNPADIMTPEFVAGRLVKVIQSGRGGQIILPDTLSMKFASILRALPNWIAEALKDTQSRAQGMGSTLE